MLAAINANTGPNVESGGSRESSEGCSAEETEAEEVAIGKEIRSLVLSKQKLAHAQVY
jgi:hypothetical protein